MIAMPLSTSPVLGEALAGKIGWRAWFRVLTPLLLVLVACLAFRMLLAKGEPRLLFSLPPELVAQPWKLLFPFDFGSGRYRWTPTGYAVVGLMNVWIAAPWIFVVLLALLVVVAYGLSWLAFRSRVFSTTLALCMGFGTQFNYSYVHNGGHLWLVFTMYLLINLYFLHELATRVAAWRGPKIGFAASLMVFALCWEQWLDYPVFLLTISSFAYLLCRRDPVLRERYLGRIQFVALTTLLVMAGYLAVKLPYSSEHFTPGHESDAIFTYSSPILGLDDLISNVFTYPYIALTNFCPSWFNGSNSLYHLGADRILQEQNGYHPQRAHLVGMHHLFFWHFYAGAVFLAFVWCGLRSLRAAWTTRSYQSLMLLAMLCLIATGFATHSIIKFRPYLSVPLLAYKCLISVIGVSLLLSYLLTIASKGFSDRRKYLAFIGFVWLFLLFTAVERFSYHSQMSQEAGLGVFPEPIQTAKQTLQDLRSHWRRSH